MHMQVSDAGRRMSDIVNGKIVAHPFDEMKNSWMAFKLLDGSSDGNLYDSKSDAVRHQLDEFSCCYLFMRECMSGMSARDATIYMEFNRKAHAAGMRMPDPAQVIAPTGRDMIEAKLLS